ncbi:CHAT domain-containing protein [Lactarius psammicola]|nr:CHAT domain-containing protein [Lactarius psammicola]
MAVPQQSIHEIDSFISHSQHSLSALLRSHPLRPACVYSLATARFDRYELSNQEDDLDKATESILLQPWSCPEPKPNILEILFNPAVTLILRSKGSKQPEDVTYAAKYLRHLRDRPHQAFGFPRHEVTTMLLEALAVQVKLEAGNVMRKIGEMAALCHELLTLDMSDVDTTRSIYLFAMAVLSKIRLGVPDQPLDQLIECLRAARKYKPDLREACFALALSLHCRYCMTFVNDDYEEAASVLDELIASSSPGDSQDKFVAIAHEFATRQAMIRSKIDQTPENLEEAIYRARAFLNSSPVRESSRPLAVFDLKAAAKERFGYFGSIEGLEALSDNSPLSQPVTAVASEKNDDLEFIRMDKEINPLLSGILNNDDIKIDEAVEKARTILASSSPSDPRASLPFATFGDVLFEAFRRTKKIEYLNESISILRQVLKHPLMRPLRFATVGQLALSLFTRSGSFPGHGTQDLDEAMELLSQCVNDAHANFPDRFRFASTWASFARNTKHPSVSIAYEAAVSLIQDTLLFAPTLQLQHVTLSTIRRTHSMSLDYASYQVDLGQLEKAIETLERGRALLWSEMRSLRTSIDQLLQADPQLGYRFTVINRDLEELTKSIPPSHKLSIDDRGGADDGVKAVDPFGRLLLKQRSLLKDRNKLISQIQALPGFDSFLASPSFDTLRSSASSGPVIFINHSIWRSDILILLHNTSPSLITTLPNFYLRANALRNELLDARNKYGPDSTHYNQTLAYVLTELYDLVGKPVIDRLRQLNVPEQSRVWWCPTSVFCSLPLHAMGPIPSDDGGDDDRYFLDIYIPSYTPTLSALILESDNRDPGLPTSDPPSLLLVAHFDVPSPDVSLSEVCKDVKVVQALHTRLPVKSLISEAATATSALDGLRDHQFVHFVCHGTLEARKPFDAGFELHGNERLTLLNIVRSHLPAAEFAFLSACHTAEVTDGSSADEGLHLAAAVQYCGFRSVVGTMWAMANDDGPELAKHFYKSMFLRREQGEPMPYYKRSAGALRDAVKKLRKKRGITLERWVNFVHYGA